MLPFSDETSPTNTADALLLAYQNGLFPMADPDSGAMYWCSPEMRGILPLTEADGLHISRSLARTIRRDRFMLRTDTRFEDVVRACAYRPEDGGSWIDERIVRWYTTLFEQGNAHCIEAYVTDPANDEEVLVGGVYGVSIGRAFFGESMFSRPRPRLPNGSRHPLDGADASKVCLVSLAKHLHACGYALFDTQFQNDHIEQFGVIEIPREDYLERLLIACGSANAWAPFPHADST